MISCLRIVGGGRDDDNFRPGFHQTVGKNNERDWRDHPSEVNPIEVLHGIGTAPGIGRGDQQQEEEDT